jgi:hypothetical protein
MFFLPEIVLDFLASYSFQVIIPTLLVGHEYELRLPRPREVTRQTVFQDKELTSRILGGAYTASIQSRFHFWPTVSH